MRTVAILTAAGSGARLGADRPKALVELDGLPLVTHAARRLLAAAERLVVTAPPSDVDAVAAALVGLPAEVVPGGPTRQASVAAGLARLVESADLDPTDVVLVHDAARPLVPVEVVRRVAEVAAQRGAAVPGLAVTDTVKQVDPAVGGAERISATPDRRLLRAVQTPQGFGLDLLRRAHAAGAHLAADEGIAATDDAALVETLGVDVWVVPGHPDAMKITTAADLAVAELLLAAR